MEKEFENFKELYDSIEDQEMRKAVLGILNFLTPILFRIEDKVDRINLRYKNSWIDFKGDGMFPKERMRASSL